MEKPQPCGAYALLVAYVIMAIWVMKGCATEVFGHPGGVAPVSTTHHLHKLRCAKALDLPLDPPSLGGPPWFDSSLSPPTPDQDEEDPRDTPPPIFFGEEIDTEADTIVYVIDKSGSMGKGIDALQQMGSSAETRMAKAARAFINSVNGLADNMRFSALAYSCIDFRKGSLTLFPALREATAANKFIAVQWARALSGNGNTGTGPAMQKALTKFPDCDAFILLTDGAPGCNHLFDAPLHLNMINFSNNQEARVDVFGVQAIGTFRTWCQAVASDNDGAYHDVP